VAEYGRLFPTPNAFSVETVSHKPFQSSYAKVAELKKTLRVEQFTKERALAGGLIHLSSLVHVTRQMQSVGDKIYESIPDANTNVVVYRHGKPQEKKDTDARAATPLDDHFSRAPPRTEVNLVLRPHLRERS
jgi:hypothetical protein